MHKTLFKNIRREITSAPGRFIAVLLIIILGASFYTGLRSVAPSMKLTADDYYVGTQLADFRILSDFGVTDADIAALRERPEVAQVMPLYTADVLAKSKDGIFVYVVRSIPATVSDETSDYLSRLTLTEGRMPENAWECLADSASESEIGDRITITDENEADTLDLFGETTFTVVGIAYAPSFISIERGNTTIGNGKIDYFLYLPEASFDSEYYIEADILLKTARDMSAFSDTYKDIIAAEEDVFEAFGIERAEFRYADIREDAEKELAEGQKEYDDAKAEADEKLADALKEIEEGQADLDAGYREYREKEKEIADAGLQVANGKYAVEFQREQLTAAVLETAAARAQVEAKRAELAAGHAQLDALITAGADPALIAALQAQLAAGDAQLAAADLQTSAAEAQLRAADAQLSAGEGQVLGAEQALADGKIQLADGKKKLDDAEKELVDGRAEYEDAKAEAEKELEEARIELEDGRKELEELEKPEWFVFSRDDNPGYSGFESDAARINGLSMTITSFLFLVAALVCLTTMTRMVEEQRLQIGTLKALGYRKGTIMFKFIFYALLIGVLGGVIGVILGLVVFPRVIWNAYAMLYTMDDMQLAIALVPCLIGALGGLVATMTATLVACGSDLRLAAAELMRPKAPKAGKRVLLERVSIIWKHLRFSHKVTIRNLFRNKRRFVTTIFGVAGCCALLLTGLGIRDSIGSMVELQYGELNHALIDVYLDGAGSRNDDTEINEVLGAHGQYAYVYIADASASKGRKNNNGMQTYLYVPENPDMLKDFIDLRERVGKKEIAFPPVLPAEVRSAAGADLPGVVITEKLAKQLDAKPGDEIEFAAITSREMKAIVTGVTENYIYNYIYLTPESYTSMFGAEPEYTTAILIPDKAEDADLLAALTDIIKTENVKSATSTVQIKDLLNDIVRSLNAIVWVIIGVAGGLAMVVLYNLTNINIIERERELATLKVLGFYRTEVSAYVNRESMVLTVIGIICGLLCGILLHRYVMDSVEVSEFMFGRLIKPVSFLYATLFTLFCGIAINISMHPKILKIDPVGALKSAE
ncbi:MAG: FtsX-like permease family protein [Clostridiales Family XIII bacterium]|jgi:putative ABC transport system permease protein|nr:FtsX-like permease family protein [Clostridiales Family XIII bacterium]